jgi:hypothetical protein
MKTSSKRAATILVSVHGGSCEALEEPSSGKFSKLNFTAPQKCARSKTNRTEKHLFFIPFQRMAGLS